MHGHCKRLMFPHQKPGPSLNLLPPCEQVTFKIANVPGDGWVKVVDDSDPDAPAEYYFNNVTGASQWEQPPNFKDR